MSKGQQGLSSVVPQHTTHRTRTIVVNSQFKKYIFSSMLFLKIMFVYLRLTSLQPTPSWNRISYLFLQHIFKTYLSHKIHHRGQLLGKEVREFERPSIHLSLLERGALLLDSNWSLLTLYCVLALKVWRLKSLFPASQCSGFWIQSHVMSQGTELLQDRPVIGQIIIRFIYSRPHLGKP